VKLLQFLLDVWRTMTPAKWLQLVTYALAWCGYLNFLADKKWTDEKRTERNRQFFRLVRTLYSTVLLIVGLALIYSFGQREKKPYFAFFLNGIALDKDTLVTLPWSDEVSGLTFSVQNVGTAPSDGISLTVDMPLQFDIINSRSWDSTSYNVLERGAVRSTNPAKIFYRENAFTMILPSNYLEFPTLQIRCTNLLNTVNIIHLSAFAKNSARFQTKLYLRYSPNTTEPFTGERPARP